MREGRTMRKCVAGFAVLLVAGSAAAQGQSWKAGIALLADKSMRNCREQPQIEWTFTEDGSTFSGLSNAGTKFSTQMAADGSVKHNYRGQLGALTFETEIAGNAKLRQLEIYNITHSCRYRVVPK
jgi:hypothetical protein